MAPPGTVGYHRSRRDDIGMGKELGHGGADLQASLDPALILQEGGQHAYVGSQVARPGPIFDLDFTRTAQKLKRTETKAEFAERTGLVGFLEKDDLDAQEEEEAMRESVVYSQWLLSKLPLHNPVAAKMLKELEPDIYQRAVETLDHKIETQKELARLEMFGPTTQDELRKLFYYETYATPKQREQMGEFVYGKLATPDMDKALSIRSLFRAQQFAAGERLSPENTVYVNGKHLPVTGMGNLRGLDVGLGNLLHPGSWFSAGPMAQARQVEYEDYYKSRRSRRETAAARWNRSDTASDASVAGRIWGAPETRTGNRRFMVAEPRARRVKLEPVAPATPAPPTGA